MNSDNEISRIQLTEEQFEELEKLAALGYSNQELAMYFNLDVGSFITLAESQVSDINFRIRRGKLISQAKEKMALLESAEGGNVTAIQQLDKIRRKRNFELKRDDFLFGFDPDDVSRFEKLEAHITGGSVSQLTNDEALYVELLTMINALRRRYGKLKTIKFLTKKPFSIPATTARNMFDESINMFYSDRNADRKALRAAKGEMIEEAALLLLQSATTAKEFDVFKNMMLASAELQGLNEEVPEPLSNEFYIKPVKVYVLDPEQVGLGSINRTEVAQQIDELKVPEHIKQRVRMDANIETVQFEEILNELPEENKD